MADHLTFGVFHAPYHLPMGQNPTLALTRDVEFVQHLDRIGFAKPGSASTTPAAASSSRSR